MEIPLAEKSAELRRRSAGVGDESAGGQEDDDIGIAADPGKRNRQPRLLFEGVCTGRKHLKRPPLPTGSVKIMRKSAAESASQAHRADKPGSARAERSVQTRAATAS